MEPLPFASCCWGHKRGGQTIRKDEFKARVGLYMRSIHSVSTPANTRRAGSMCWQETMKRERMDRMKNDLRLRKHASAKFNKRNVWEISWIKQNEGMNKK